jgi:hypothetical protein
MSDYFTLSPIKLLEKKSIYLNEKQKEIVKSVNDNRVTVVVATRRGGKSEIAAACNICKLLEPGTYQGITAPTMNHTDIIFSNIVDTFHDTLQLKPSKLNNKDKDIRFKWQARGRATTLKNRKTIAGRAYNLFTGDEIGLADYMEDSNWLYQEVLPATITTQGHILIISTPRGMNHLYDIYEAAEIEKNWNRIRYTIWDVEHIPREEIENMERLYKDQRMEKVWAQEFLAEFVSFEGAIFDFIPEFVEQAPDPDLVLIGVDPGTQHATVKLHIHKKHGVFVTFVDESEKSTSEHGKLLQTLTQDSDLNVCDSAAKQFIQDMAYDFEVPLNKAVKDVDQGVNFLRRLKDHIFIVKGADTDNILIKEWSMYSHKDGRIVKKLDHTIDAIRYALYTAYQYWGDEFFSFLLPEEAIIHIDL